ncbi:phage recombination protein Bet, partial [mine drainage metagenome]
GSPPLRSASDLRVRPCGGLTAEQVAVLRSADRFPPDSTADEIAFGLEVARRIGLDVWLGQVKFLRFDPADKIHPFVGIDGMRAVAERSGQYDGREIDVELAKGPDGREKPVKAVCRVHRKDWSRPLVEEVWFEEAVRKRKDGQPTRPWVEMPVTMLRKAAEERALRASLPAPARRGLRRAGSSDGVERVSAAIRSPTEPRSIGQPGVLTGVHAECNPDNEAVTRRRTNGMLSPESPSTTSWICVH